MQPLTRQTYKKRQLFVDFSEVYIITSVESRGEAEAVEQYIHYRPYYPAKNEQTLTYTESSEGFAQGYKRHLVTKKDIKDILLRFTATLPEVYEYDIDALLEAVKLSQLNTLTDGVKYLWDQMQADDADLSYNKRDMYRTLLLLICNELAVVLDSSPAKVRSMIKQKLKSREVEDTSDS